MHACVLNVSIFNIPPEKERSFWIVHKITQLTSFVGSDAKTPIMIGMNLDSLSFVSILNYSIFKWNSLLWLDTTNWFRFFSKTILTVELFLEWPISPGYSSNGGYNPCRKTNEATKQNIQPWHIELIYFLRELIE